MFESLRGGKRVTLDRVGMFADGVAVRRVGEETFRLARQYVDEIMLVSTDQICAAIQDIFQDTRSIAEPAGALAVAGIKKYVARENCSGAHVDRGQLRRQHEFRPLALRRRARGYRRAARGTVRRADAGGARFIFAVLRVAGQAQRHGIQLPLLRSEGGSSVREPGADQGRTERDALLAEIIGAGFAARDMSDNEMAKLHVRYMVGGHARGLADEKLYRFEFPERPGALLKFLQAIGTKWNVSLFHYRNHGSDHGRVLAGIQVPAGDPHRFFIAHQRAAVRLHGRKRESGLQDFFGRLSAAPAAAGIFGTCASCGGGGFTARARRFSAKSARAARPHRQRRELSAAPALRLRVPRPHAGRLTTCSSA